MSPALIKWLARVALGCALLACIPGWADEAQPGGNEKELKVAFLYNFALFTEWPPEVGSTLTFCILGADAFGAEIEALQGKSVAGHSTVVVRKGLGDSLKSCQVVFIGAKAMAILPRVLDELRDRPVLTVADSMGAARAGVALNMVEVRNKITFEANLLAVRAARLKLSSKLLRLATEVYQ